MDGWTRWPATKLKSINGEVIQEAAEAKLAGYIWPGQM